jgi:hypothetical protein
MQGQARAPKTQPFGAEAFEVDDRTVLRWLGMAGFLINSRGPTLMVDPLLGGFDMPVMIEFPIAAADVPRLDAVLVTHSDNDHYSVPTCRDLAAVTGEYHSTHYVASLMHQEGLPAYGHDHLRMPTADAMLFDFSDSEWHFGLDGAIEMANVYPHTPLLLYHWGSVDAPDSPPFNADPDSLPGRVENPEASVSWRPASPSSSTG